jgi:hypothetical protein
MQNVAMQQNGQSSVVLQQLQIDVSHRGVLMTREVSAHLYAFVCLFLLTKR